MKITIMFRDEFLRQRMGILRNYAKENSCNIYYVYNTHSKDKDTLLLAKYGDEEKVVSKFKSELEQGVEIGTVLDEDFKVDKEATEYIAKELENLYYKLEAEENEYLAQKNIDGHVYLVTTVDKDRIWLLDKSVESDIEEEIEEINISEDLIKSVNIGDLLLFTNSMFEKISDKTLFNY